MLGLLGAMGTHAQAPTWRIVAGADSLASVAASRADAPRLASQRLAALGYVLARIDSLTADTLSAPAVWVTPGPRFTVGEIVISGAEVLAESDLRDGWQTRVGAPLDSLALAADLALSLSRYQRLGHVRARLTPSVVLDAEAALVRVAVGVEEGDRPALARVDLVGARRTSAGLVTRTLGLRPGEAFADYDPARLQRDLDETGLFERVGVPALAEDEAGVVLRIPVEEGPPGAFDVVLGYLPPAAGQSGQLVGRGRLDLRGPFGGGRSLTLALDRNPGLASRFDFAVSDPFVAGLPLRVALAFEGEGRDSTYNRQRLAAEAGSRVARGLDLAVTLAGETVQPGRFGAALDASGRPRVRRASALLLGVAFRYRRVDRRLAPRRGIAVDAVAERGLRTRSPLADSVAAEPTRVAQQRARAGVRVYVPVLARQSLALGADLRAVLVGRDAGGQEGTAYDEGELIRFGGARSLRGYDEEAFLANVAARALAEVRTALGGDSYAFAFADLGVVDTPALGAELARRDVLPGYGLGAQLQTAAGLVTLTYALNPDLPALRGKVHLGLSLGL